MIREYTCLGLKRDDSGRPLSGRKEGERRRNRREKEGELTCMASHFGLLGLRSLGVTMFLFVPLNEESAFFSPYSSSIIFRISS